MKKPKYVLHCPVCGEYINHDATIYKVDGEWMCEDCMLDTVSDDYEFLERCDYDSGTIAEEMGYDYCSALDKWEETFWSEVDYKIDELKDNNY